MWGSRLGLGLSECYKTDLKNKLQITYFRASEDADVEQGTTNNFGQSIFHQTICEGSDTKKEKYQSFHNPRQEV